MKIPTCTLSGEPAIRKCATSFFFFFFSVIPKGNEKKSTVNSYNLILYHFHTKCKGKQP